MDYFSILYVCKEMGIPLWKALLTTGWQDELSKQFAWSFNTSVAALVSGRFQVPIDSVVQEESGGIQFEMNMETPDGGSSSTEDDNNLEGEANNDERRTESESSVPSNDDIDVGNDGMLRGMLEEKLYDLYMGANKFGSKQMQVKLKTRPIAWRLVGGSVIPFVTREDVKRKPELRGALRDLQDQLRSNSEIRSANDLGRLMSDAKQWFQNETGHNEWRTIVLQIAIHCAETFYVRDIETNAIIQGNENGTEQEVLHLVRFEMVTKEGEKPKKVPFFSPLGPPETRILGR